MNSKATFQPQSFMSCSRKHTRVESISVARMDRLCSYLEQDNDSLQAGIEELNNKLEQMRTKYDELSSKYAILQKENEELKNKSKKQVVVPQEPVPQLGSNEELEEEDYVNEDFTDEQLLNAVISVSNQPEKNMGTGNPAGQNYNEEENNYLTKICLELGVKEKQSRENYDNAYKKIMKLDKSCSEYKNLKKERTEAKKNFEKARKEFNGKNIIALFKKRFKNAKTRQDNHLQQKVTRIKGELRKEGKIPKNTKAYYDTEEAKAFRKSQKEEIETY